ncbi:MAG: glycosyltransferase [Bacteroidales bacterium]|nr:glycosyltransferase [Bacteroidales bacterium]
MFGWEFPPHIAGGLGTACEGIVKGLAHNGVETIFVMPSASGDEDQSCTTIVNASDVAVRYASSTVDEFIDRVKFINVDSNLVPYSDPDEYFEAIEKMKKFRRSETVVGFGQKFKFSGKYGAGLLEEVSRYAQVCGTIAMQYKDSIDLIHAHDWLTYLAGIAAKELTGKPLVVHVHATSFDRGTDDMVDSRVYAIEKRGMEAADRVVTVSDLTRNIVINKYGIDPAKVVTVHNAVDFSGRENISVRKGVKDKVVTFLGRITFQKGPEYFIEAAAKVLKVCPDTRFVMAGSGDMMTKAIRQVARLGISDRFHFTGFLRGKEVQEMFAMSDVYIMPSVSEPFGISPLEAMRSNVPSVISRQSGAAEVLKYALKVDFWDVDAMADDIYALVQYPALAEFAAKQGYDEVNRIKWDAATAKLKEVYKSIL